MLLVGSHSLIINTAHPWSHSLQLPVELYKSAPSRSHSYTLLLVLIALLEGEGAKYPNDSLSSLKSSFIFLCERHALDIPHAIDNFFDFIMPIIMHVMCGETTSKLSGPATSNYEVNYPPLFYMENTKISVY